MSAGSVLAQDAQPAAAPGAPKEPDAAPAEEPKAKRPAPEGPDDRLRFAVIGCGGRGASHVDDLLNMADHVKIVALCDPDEAHAGAYATRVEDETGERPRIYTDVRKLLEDKDIHAVTIATPNHWHSLGAIWAMQAGKDVYVEKPLSHNVMEGRRLVETARKTNRICLHGTQSRSSRVMNQAMQFLHEGGLGKVFLARGLCYKNRPSIGRVSGEQPIPTGLDYDHWCGPAPLKPLMRQNLHYDWHWVWDYGNGDIGNQGVHQMDICLWGLQQRQLAKRVQAVGGRFGYVDDGQTPNTQVALFDYDDAQIIFEVRGLESKPVPGAKQGVCNVFYGTEGTLVVNSYDDVSAYAPNGERLEMPAYKGDASGNHMATFVKAIKSRTLDFNQGEAEVGHLSSALCHMANISYRLGAEAPFDPGAKAFGDDRAAYATLARMEQHLTKNGLKLEETKYLLGPSLDFDPKAERFTNNDAANKLMTREYRAPYVVPSQIA
jgi:predicted dehydrogenase